MFRQKLFFILVIVCTSFKTTYTYYSEYNEVDYQKENDSTYHSVTDSVLPAWNYYANLFVFYRYNISILWCGYS